MTGQITPETLYWGLRENVITELGELTHIYEGKYLLQLDGPAAWDADGVDTIKDAEAIIEEIKAAYPGIKICRV